MSDRNKATLKAANTAIAAGDVEGFLSFCADESVWTLVGDRTLAGKEAIRQWMAETYLVPPKFEVASMIAEGDFVVAVGEISIQDENAQSSRYSYCDVWRFRDGKMIELRAFVVDEAAT